MGDERAGPVPHAAFGSGDAPAGVDDLALAPELAGLLEHRPHEVDRSCRSSCRPARPSAPSARRIPSPSRAGWRSSHRARCPAGCRSAATAWPRTRPGRSRPRRSRCRSPPRTAAPAACRRAGPEESEPRHPGCDLSGNDADLNGRMRCAHGFHPLLGAGSHFFLHMQACGLPDPLMPISRGRDRARR